MSDQQPPAGGYPPPSPPSSPPPPPPGPPSYPPPPSSPPWGPPPGGPAQPEPKGLGLWITLAVVGAVALVGVLIALVLLMTGDDGDDGRDAAAEPTASATTGSTSPSETASASPSPSAAPSSADPGDPDASGAPPAGSTADAVPNEPEAVVDALFSSIFAGDCATAEDLVTQDYISGVGSCEAAELPTEMFEGVTWEVGEAQVDEAAGTATVELEISAAGQSQTATVELVKEGGRWLVSSAE